MPSSLHEFQLLIEQWGGSHPWLIFAALLVLPGVGCPGSVLLVLAGAVWGPTPASCGLALLAIGLNIVWTHVLAAGPGRAIILRVLGERWKRWEGMGGTNRLQLAVMLRMTPGMPLFVQNYVLGLLQVPLLHSLAVALPITGLYVCGFVLTGGAIFEGRVGLAVSGLGLVVAAAVVVRLIATVRRKRSNPGA